MTFFITTELAFFETTTCDKAPNVHLLHFTHGGGGGGGEKQILFRLGSFSKLTTNGREINYNPRNPGIIFSHFTFYEKNIGTLLFGVIWTFYFFIF